MNEIMLITAAGVVTWLLRASFITLAGDRALPVTVNEVLRHARIAVLAALVATALAGSPAAGDPQTLLPRVVGVLVAGAVAWRWRSLTPSLASGFAAFWAVEGALRLVG
jgi:branched-subunit amino acid transport protein